MYLKTIGNTAKRSNIRLYTDIVKARQVAGKPHWINWRLFFRRSDWNLDAVRASLN